ncbi:ABC transporter ATP-binding protein [Pseudobacteriovorax antillogorgiicola]|uniref:ABC transporter ATP-binding protein n=1 Tax=Pseudobacteriovorax antillogorgiicola TaxID=1513793 RepID=UPI0010453D59|nr:ABC transporter ATP-binding protein [Pseudobacteriovorax antillogorgiicola]
MTPQNILSLKQVTKNYKQGQNEIEILKGLDLDVVQGQTVAIIGQSGSGKSTLLSLIAGLDTPSSGDVKINEQNINELDEKSLTRFRGANIGIVFQQFHLMSHLTALDNVRLPLDILGQDNAVEKARDALKLVKLDHREDHLPQQMSGGENQRVAIARSFVVNPKLLLADEPSGSLDQETGKVIMDLLFHAVNERQMTMVLVTHNQDLAKRCDHIWELKQGQLHKR